MRADLLLTLLLLSADLAFISIHLVHAYTGLLADPMYSLERERGYAEQFQYVKLYWLIVLFGAFTVVRRQLIHVAWMAVFAVALIDDCFGLHETYGEVTARGLGLQPALGLRAGDIGELLILAGAGATLLTVVALAFLTANAAERRFSVRIVALSAGMAFFGVVVDAAHSMARGTWAHVPIGAVEDGGELVMVSLILWVVFRHGQALDASVSSAPPLRMATVRPLTVDRSTHGAVRASG